MVSDIDSTSASVTGGILGRHGERIGADAESVVRATEELGRSWTGPSSVAARRRIDTLTDGAVTLAGEMSRASAAFQSLATEVAELDGALARLQSRAAVAGLVVDDLGVHHRPGPRPVADPATEARLESTRVALDQELGALGVRRRTAVTGLLRALDPAAASRVAAACRS